MFCRLARSAVAWKRINAALSAVSTEDLMKRFALVLVALGAVALFAACKDNKKKGGEAADPAAKPADSTATDQAKPEDKPADPAATDPAAKPADPAAADPAAAA